ncbi:MAG: copper chaperone PCu(A)C [Thermomicrobiales bacterium]
MKLHSTWAIRLAIVLMTSAAFAGAATAQDSSSVATPEASPAASPEASPIAMSTAAVFMVIVNDGEEADRLVAAESDAAMTIEIHEVAEVSGVMAMRPLEDGLEIPAGESVVLEPGGYHLMMIGLTGDLTPGETFDVTLTFERAGEITVTSLIVMGNQAPEEGVADPVTAGDITVSVVWSRGAPAMAGHGGR